MGNESATVANIPPAGVWAFGLALRRNCRSAHRRALLPMLPFLALARRPQTGSSVAGGSALTLPWLLPGWLAWPSPQPSSTPTGQVFAGEPRALVGRGRAKDLTILATLSPVLRWAAQVSQTTSAVSGGRAALPASVQTGLPTWSSAEYHTGRKRPVLQTDVGGAIGHRNVLLPVRSLSFAARAQEAAISNWEHRAFEAQPAPEHEPILSAELPGRGAEEGELPEQDTFPHPGITTPVGAHSGSRERLADEATPHGWPGAAGLARTLPERQPAVLGQPGPYVTPSPRGLHAVVAGVRQLVEREVAAEINRQRADRPTPPTAQAGVSKRMLEQQLTSDEVVRLLMHKIRALAQEDRFRSGLLR